MKKFVLVTLCAILFVGCTSTKIRYHQGQSLHKVYQGAYAKCPVNTEYGQYLEERLNYYLKKRKIFAQDLLIECSITDFNEGSRALRLLVGFGAGRATSRINITLKENDVEVANFEGLSSVKGGIIGGSFKGALDANADEIVEFVLKNYIQKK